MVIRLKRASAVDNDLSPAERALLSKFKTIKYHKAQAEIKRRNSETLESTDTGTAKKDARQAAIEIIRARRLAQAAQSEGSKPKKTKIKLTSKQEKPGDGINPLVSASKDNLSNVPSTSASKGMSKGKSEDSGSSTVARAEDSASAGVKREEKKRHVVHVKRRAVASTAAAATDTAAGTAASTHVGAPSGAPIPDSQPPTLFVDHLPESCGESELLEYFGGLCQLQVTGLYVYEGCQSALVTFHTLEEAQSVLSHAHTMNIGGHPLSARWAGEEDIKASTVRHGVAMDTMPSDPRMAAQMASHAPHAVPTTSDAREDHADEYHEDDRGYGDGEGGDYDHDDGGDGGDDQGDGEDDPRSRNVVSYDDL